jgi:hypothetical protein
VQTNFGRVAFHEKGAPEFAKGSLIEAPSQPA